MGIPLIFCLVFFLHPASGNSNIYIASGNPNRIPSTPYHLFYAVPIVYQPILEQKSATSDQLKPTLKVAEVGPIAETPISSSATFNKYHVQSTDGSYTFGYFDGPSSKSETRDVGGNVKGIFNYLDPTGELHTRLYTSGSSGFNVAASDLPLALAVNDLSIPKETVEVKAAREKFEKAFQEAKNKIRSKRSTKEDISAPGAKIAPASTTPLNIKTNKNEIATTYAVVNPFHLPYYPKPYNVSPRENVVPVVYSAVAPQPLYYNNQNPIFPFSPKARFITKHPNGFTLYL